MRPGHIHFDPTLFIEFCKTQHDVVCNQKYDDRHPYSFHLDMVAKQAELFKHLIPIDEPYYSAVICGCWGHDLIEDARLTWNDIYNRTNKETADIIYCCTEEKGKNRTERHSDKYFDELAQNDLAIFVKLCDIIANVKYGLLTNSGMFGKYAKEFPHMKSKLYREEYKEMFDYLGYLLKVD